MTTPSAVVFDIGNVVVQWDPRYLYRDYFDGDETLMEMFLEDVCTPAWNRELDRGLPWAEGIARLTERFPECAELIRAYDERWMEMVPDVVAGTPEVLRELKDRGTPLYAITNFSVEKYRLTKARYPILDLFDHVVVSAEVGLLKPDPEIYRLLCKRRKLDPAEALFTDDSKDNCEGAIAIGMAAHHFTGSAGLRRALERLGLL
jgi:2-haloacid dehalogenase